MIKSTRKLTTALMTQISILAAIATVLTFFELPLWFLPPFYKIDLSEIVVLIGGFTLGVVPAIIIEGIKIILFALIRGSTTGGVGEIANFLIGCSLVIPSALIYKKFGSIKSAICGVTVGVISMTIVASILNAFVLLPLYASVFGMNIDSLIAMGTAINKNILNLQTFILLAVVPFNLIKGILSSILAIMLFKKVSSVFLKFNHK